jgi:hypothetical protein
MHPDKIGGHMNRTRLTILCCFVALLTLALAGNVSSQTSKSGNLKTAIAPVYLFNTTTVVPAAGASLSRNNDSVFATISTSGLTPDDVVTLWWAIFNNPEFCANPGCAAMDLNNPAVNGSLQYGGGQVVGLNGRADFGGYLAVGDNTGFHFLSPSMPNPAPGVVNPKGATIHLVIRRHGPASADPSILNQQLSSFGGGCSLNPCSNVQAALFPQ